MVLEEMMGIVLLVDNVGLEMVMLKWVERIRKINRWRKKDRY